MTEKLLEEYKAQQTGNEQEQRHAQQKIRDIVQEVAATASYEQAH